MHQSLFSVPSQTFKNTFLYTFFIKSHPGLLMNLIIMILKCVYLSSKLQTSSHILMLKVICKYFFSNATHFIFKSSYSKMNSFTKFHIF